MKIEIELEEVEKLRRQVEHQYATITELENKIESLDEVKLKGRCIRLSKRLVNEYLTAIFNSLGFDNVGDSWHPTVQFDNSLEYELGDKWFESTKIEVNVSATLKDNFRRVFLRIGAVPKDIEKHAGIEL